MPPFSKHAIIFITNESFGTKMLSGGCLRKAIEKERAYIIEIWEMKNYLVLPRRVLISFRYYFLFTRNDSVLSTNEYWKEIPLKEEKLCVISSPSDNYRWTARQCNGPDVASFICEMPSKKFFPCLFSFHCYLSFGVFQRLQKKSSFSSSTIVTFISVPKWVQKSACLDSLNPTITVTFHPERSMIKAGRVCPNTDVKYIECHDPVSILILSNNLQGCSQITVL